MSAHSEIQNYLHTKSGDASIFFYSRSGDSQEGHSYFDIRPSTTETPEAVLINKEQGRARVAFLKGYFSLLSSVLSDDEMRFLKLKIKTKKPAKLVACWCGLNIRNVYQSIREKLSDCQEDIEELIDGSAWENAELFANTFLKSLKELSKDEEALENVYNDPQGDFDELTRAREYRALRERIMTIQEERHRLYSRGFEAGKQSAKRAAEKSSSWREYKSLLCMEMGNCSLIEGILDSGASDIIEMIKGTIKVTLEFLYKKWDEAESLSTESLTGVKNRSRQAAPTF